MGRLLERRSVRAASCAALPASLPATLAPRRCAARRRSGAARPGALAVSRGAALPVASRAPPREAPAWPPEPQHPGQALGGAHLLPGATALGDAALAPRGPRRGRAHGAAANARRSVHHARRGRRARGGGAVGRRADGPSGRHAIGRSARSPKGGGVESASQGPRICDKAGAGAGFAEDHTIRLRRINQASRPTLRALCEAGAPARTLVGHRPPCFQPSRPEEIWAPRTCGWACGLCGLGGLGGWSIGPSFGWVGGRVGVPAVPVLAEVGIGLVVHLESILVCRPSKSYVACHPSDPPVVAGFRPLHALM